MLSKSFELEGSDKLGYIKLDESRDEGTVDDRPGKLVREDKV